MKLACGLAAALAVAFVHAAPLTALRLVALSNAGNQELTLPLAATDAATGEGMLGTTYAAQWTREGPRLALHVTRKDDGAYWRLALQATFAPACETLKIGYGSLPVALPLKRITKPGQCYWFWENGRPDWIAATGPDGASALVPETATHHGFFLIRQPDGSTLAQFALDAWKPGDSTDIAVRLGDETALPQASREAPPGKNRLGSGFIRVGSDGHGFVTPAGQPWQAMGRNQWPLPVMPAADQERVLDEMVANKMTVTRVGLMDCCYWPLPGVWNDEAVRRLRQTLDRCAAHGVRVVVCLEYSACGYQYSTSTHDSPAWSDLYLLDSMTQRYAQIVERVVKPLRNHPAILAWNVTNEPLIEPDGKSPLQQRLFDAWLAAQGKPTAKLPTPDEFEKQSTPAARDFCAWGSAALSDALIARARLVRAADPNHLLTISHGNPRLLLGHDGAELFDFWAPHTYDLWCNGQVIADHALLQRELFERALPGTPRPVVIEEFGMSEAPDRPEAMRAQHIRQFKEAAERYGLAGLMHWWEMSPALLAAYARPPVAPLPVPARRLAVYLPPSAEWKVTTYAPYMQRRLWGAALNWTLEQGLEPVLVRGPQDAAGAEGVLILNDSLQPDEAQTVRDMKLPVWLLPDADALKTGFPDAKQLPDLNLGARVEKQ